MSKCGSPRYVRSVPRYRLGGFSLGGSCSQSTIKRRATLTLFTKLTRYIHTIYRVRNSRNSMDSNSSDAMEMPMTGSRVNVSPLRHGESSTSRQAARCNDPLQARCSPCMHPDTTVPVVIGRTSILDAVRRRWSAHSRAKCRISSPRPRGRLIKAIPKPSEAGLDGNRPTSIGHGCVNNARRDNRPDADRGSP